jgi:hypothetical protein
MAEKTEFVLGANFGTPYGSGSQLIFFGFPMYIVEKNLISCWLTEILTVKPLLTPPSASYEEPPNRLQASRIRIPEPR